MLHGRFRRTDASLSQLPSTPDPAPVSEAPPTVPPPTPRPRASRVKTAYQRVRAAFKHPWLRRLTIVGTAVTAVTGLVATIGNLERVPRYACRIPGVHRLCGWGEVGNVAGDVEEQTWRRAKEAPQPAALRAYIAAFPTGIYASEASTRLAACRNIQREVWTAEQRMLPLYVARGDRQNSLVAAREVALKYGNVEAASACAGFAGEFRVLGAAARVREWACTQREDGTACGFDGSAECKVEARHLLTEEVCH